MLNIWVEGWKGIHSCIACLGQVDMVEHVPHCQTTANVLQLKGLLASQTCGY